VFNRFPDSWPGVGLLALRAVSGGMLALQGAAYLFDWADLSFAGRVLALSASATGVLLLLGSLTRFAAAGVAVMCGTGMFSRMPASQLSLLAQPPTNVLMSVIGLAVSLIGPGAFSIDARLFGRREIVIPTKRHDHSS
jgi:uncharacterized membrane protein YphA (DoxX/SURF4 family)